MGGEKLASVGLLLPPFEGGHRGRAREENAPDQQPRVAGEGNERVLDVVPDDDVGRGWPPPNHDVVCGEDGHGERERAHVVGGEGDQPCNAVEALRNIDPASDVPLAEYHPRRALYAACATAKTYCTLPAQRRKRITAQAGPAYHVVKDILQAQRLVDTVREDPASREPHSLEADGGAAGVGARRLSLRAWDLVTGTHVRPQFSTHSFISHSHSSSTCALELP